jgi:unsaturated rhamnogalacturonyl hydrolase
MADSALRRYDMASARWHYEDGFLLKAIEQVWLRTGYVRYWQAIEAYGDRFVDAKGAIRTYRLEEHNLDQINPGRLLFPLLAATGDQRYLQAIELLRQQLNTQPRTAEGGFWHKRIYPHQMWLDGVYMASPFAAEYATTLGDPTALDDVANQIALIERHARDERTGLLCHAWDESRRQRWADPQTGRSPHFWGRGIGWYAMALVDLLDLFPPQHPARTAMQAALLRTVTAVAAVQDRSTGIWYQILDQAGRAGNYPEASASCMFVHAIAKACRLGYLEPGWQAVARRGFQGILDNFITVEEDGLVSLHQTCGAAGLGGIPYRDGSFAYYVGEKLLTNDYKGVAPFILAALEMERAGEAHPPAHAAAMHESGSDLTAAQP